MCSDLDLGPYPTKVKVTRHNLKIRVYMLVFALVYIVITSFIIILFNQLMSFSNHAFSSCTVLAADCDICGLEMSKALNTMTFVYLVIDKCGR